MCVVCLVYAALLVWVGLAAFHFWRASVVIPAPFIIWFAFVCAAANNKGAGGDDGSSNRHQMDTKYAHQIDTGHQKNTKRHKKHEKRHQKTCFDQNTRGGACFFGKKQDTQKQQLSPQLMSGGSNVRYKIV